MNTHMIYGFILPMVPAFLAIDILRAVYKRERLTYQVVGQSLVFGTVSGALGWALYHGLSAIGWH